MNSVVESDLNNFFFSRMILKLCWWFLTHLFILFPGHGFSPDYNHFHLSMPGGSVKLCK